MSTRFKKGRQQKSATKSLPWVDWAGHKHAAIAAPFADRNGDIRLTYDSRRTDIMMSARKHEEPGTLGWRPALRKNLDGKSLGLPMRSAQVIQPCDGERKKEKKAQGRVWSPTDDSFLIVNEH